jgi:hypothetical protein
MFVSCQSFLTCFPHLAYLLFLDCALWAKNFQAVHTVFQLEHHVLIAPVSFNLILNFNALKVNNSNVKIASSIYDMNVVISGVSRDRPPH